MDVTTALAIAFAVQLFLMGLLFGKIYVLKAQLRAYKERAGEDDFVGENVHRDTEDWRSQTL